MAIQEVIKYEGENSVLIYKHPAEDFNTMSQLIVHESQEAVFFSDGQALDSFRAGRYTLETKNIPLISKLRNLVSGGVSPFHTEVYFINLATMMDIPWGTPSQVTVRDPNYGYSYSAGASGSFGLKITDGRRLLINLVGTEKKMETSDVQKYFKDLIVTRVKNCIAVELGRYSYNEFNQHLSDISESVASQIEKDISDYGIQILNFFLSSVNIKPDDLEALKNLDNSMAQKRFEAMSDEEKKKKKLLKLIAPVIIGVLSLILLHGFFRWVVVIIAVIWAWFATASPVKWDDDSSDSNKWKDSINSNQTRADYWKTKEERLNDKEEFTISDMEAVINDISKSCSSSDEIIENERIKQEDDISGYWIVEVGHGALESVDSSLKAREAVEKYCKETGIYNIHESNNVYIYYTGIRIKKIRKSQAVTIQKLIQSYGIPNVNIRQMGPNEL